MKKNKFICFFVVFAALFFVLLNNAYSDNGYSIVYEQAPTTQATTNSYISEGVALSDAFAQIDCNFSSKKWHGGIGFGFNEDYTAPAAGICKRFESVLLKGTIGQEHGKKRGGLGVMFQFE